MKDPLEILKQSVKEIKNSINPTIKKAFDKHKGLIVKYNSDKQMYEKGEDSRGLSIGQKNATDLAEQLVDTFDWILLEDAFNDNIQEEAKIYITNNKAVFATEYTDEMSSSHFESTVCPTAKTLKFTAILKHRELDGFIEVCN